METNDRDYVQNIYDADKFISTNLFRPPYGRIKRSQIRLLKEEHPEMKIVMWNILAGDWVTELEPEKCFKRIKEKISNNDIIVFHDTDKAFPRLEYSLPKILSHFAASGYHFEKIEDN